MRFVTVLFFFVMGSNSYAFNFSELPDGTTVTLTQDLCWYGCGHPSFSNGVSGSALIRVAGNSDAMCDITIKGDMYGYNKTLPSGRTYLLRPILVEHKLGVYDAEGMHLFTQPDPNTKVWKYETYKRRHYELVDTESDQDVGVDVFCYLNEKSTFESHFNLDVGDQTELEPYPTIHALRVMVLDFSLPKK